MVRCCTALHMQTLSILPCSGELHLCPLHAVVQLRPSLAHLDLAAAGRRHSTATADPGTDGEATGSEGEEQAKPVTVKIAHRDSGR